MVPEDLSQSKLDSALDGARLVYSDVRLHETALVIAKECRQLRRNLPILVDAEKKRDGLDELLNLATYMVWTEESSLPTALLSMLLRLPNVKFVIVTLGEDGCVMLERSFNKASGSEEIHIDEALESLKQTTSNDYTRPSCVSLSVMMLKADGLGTICGRLHMGTAEMIPPSELIDTTGAGDAFIGGVLCALCLEINQLIKALIP